MMLVRTSWIQRSLMLALAVLLPAGSAPATMAQRVRGEMVISTGDLAKRVERDELVVLHVARERSHYDAGHVPGALFVGWDELTATRAGVPNELAPVDRLRDLFTRIGIGDTRRIAIYGDNSGLSAARAYFTLDYLGHGARAALVDGGLEKWRAEGRPVSTTAVESKPAPFTVRLRPEVVVSHEQTRDLSWLAVNQKPATAALIDARPPAEFTGETPGEGVTRGGHIPGAANVFWKRHLESDANPVLRSERELRALFEAAGADAGRRVITYCRTGGQASHAYFVAKYLGYEVVMYDGSFFEWSNTADAPVVSGK